MNDTDLACEETTEATRINDQPVTVAELRRVFDRVCDPINWKASWAAWVPCQMVSRVTAAVEWFHADRPRVVGVEPPPSEGRVLMEGRGYRG